MLLPLADLYIRRAAGLVVTEELYTCVVLAIEPFTSLTADRAFHSLRGPEISLARQ